MHTQLAAQQIYFPPAKAAEAITLPKNAALAVQVGTVLKGKTLRGLLLNGYAFGTMDTIAAVASFIAAAVMLILSGLGLLHARRTSSAAELLPGRHEAEPVSA